ncbi:MAG: hypothetical protein WC755_01390 [Candidatus Woesearchaeota archaeon]|jgi:VanZ family protein
MTTNFEKIGIGWITFYSIVFLHYLLTGYQYYEFLGLAALFSIITFLDNGKYVHSTSLFFVGVAALSHTIGMFNYSGACNPYACVLNGNYDFYSHIFGFFFLGLAFFISLDKYKFKNKILKFQMCILIILALLGFGSMIEISEYTGFVIFGYGNGAFKFGSGDSDTYLGAWGDTSTDMIANGVGSLLGLMIFLVINLFFVKKFSHRT